MKLKKRLKPGLALLLALSLLALFGGVADAAATAAPPETQAAAQTAEAAEAQPGGETAVAPEAAGMPAGEGTAPQDGGMAPPDGGPPGGPPGGGDAAPDSGAVVITDGAENTGAEYEAGAYSSYLTADGDGITIEGLDLSSGDYTYNGIIATGTDSVVRLKKCTILLTTNGPVTDDDTGGCATAVDDGATMYLSDSELQVDGAARYVTSAYNDATLIVNDSSVTSTGSNADTAEVSEPFSNAALLISGTARANFSIGASKTYYFNSTCTAEGWAALSTDSATGDGLDLYAYNTDGVTEHGGYGTYADTNCRVWLYGSRLRAAEVGCIISKSGQIHVLDGAAAGDDVLQYNEGATTADGTTITGGRNAVMIHAPDMMGEGLAAADCGTLEVENGTLATSQDLVSTKDYADYSDAIGAYIDFVSGADILVRSTSATIALTNTEMESYSGVLVETALNADSMGNFLADGDGDAVKPVAVSMTDMDVTGDILHLDYQRNMTVDLEQTTLNGNIVSGTMESWNNQWADYGDVNWVVDDSYENVCGVALTVGDGATWNVTGDSSLTSLTLSQGGTINGTVTVDGETVTPEAGKAYTGEITVSGTFDPDAAPVASTGEESSEFSPETTEASASAAEVSTEPSPASSAAQSGGGNTRTIVLIVCIAVAVLLAVIVGVIGGKRKKK